MTERDKASQGGASQGGASPEKSSPEGSDTVAPLARHLLWVDTPEGVQKLIRWLFYLCVFLFLFDIPWPRHAYVPGEGLWGFHAIAGFVAFTLIVLGAGKLRTLIKRDETYYGAMSVDSEDYPDAGLDVRDAVDVTATEDDGWWRR